MLLVDGIANDGPRERPNCATDQRAFTRMMAAASDSPNARAGCAANQRASRRVVGTAGRGFAPDEDKANRHYCQANRMIFHISAPCISLDKHNHTAVRCNWFSSYSMTTTIIGNPPLTGDKHPKPHWVSTPVFSLDWSVKFGDVSPLRIT